MFSYPEDSPPMSDAQLQLELLQRLKLDISEELAPAKPANEEGQVSIKLSKKLQRKDKYGAIQLEEWIQIMEPLLEKEKSAEVQQRAPRRHLDFLDFILVIAAARSMKQRVQRSRMLMGS